MQNNRRIWLKQISLATAALGITPFRSFALAPISNQSISAPNDSAIFLNSNENPYGPSPLARVAMADAIIKSNRYNWNTTGNLIAEIAKKNNVNDDNILISAGSTEILDLIVRNTALQKGNFIVAHPSFTYWAKTAEKLGLKRKSVPLTKDKQHNLTAMLAEIDADTKLIYVCNPNNPTGTICEHEALIAFIEEASKKATVMIDEAYLDFTNQTSVSGLVSENKNLIVVKTFSKIYGLAGARIGYAIAHKETIKKLGEDFQTWANGGVSVVSRAAALATIGDATFLKQCYDKNEAARKYTIEQLTQLNITCIPSHTNFLYFSLNNYKNDYFALLKKHSIEGTYFYEEEGKWTRITIGTMEEMKKFIAALK